MIGITSTIHIRQVRRDDAEDVVRIYIQSWNEGFAELMPTREITAEVVTLWTHDLENPFPHRWWVAETNDRVVGFAGICPSRDPIDPSLGELDTIAVDPLWWRRGVGRRLITHAQNYLVRDGYREAVLWTLANYERGQRFYEAMGWEADGGRRDEGRQIRYRRELQSAVVQGH